MLRSEAGGGRRCDDILADNGKVGCLAEGGGVLLRFVPFSPAVFSCLSTVAQAAGQRGEEQGHKGRVLASDPSADHGSHAGSGREIRG